MNKLWHSSTVKMTALNCILLCLVISGATESNKDTAAIENGHRLIKRQAQDALVSVSSQTLHSQRHFVSPDRQPYYEYQPPISSNRESSSYGRQASAHVSIGGAPSGRQATSQDVVGGAPSGRQATSQGAIEGAPSGRHASAHLTINGGPSGVQSRQSSNGTGLRFGSPAINTKGSVTGQRGRTYKYPFGRERIHYTNSQDQQQLQGSPDIETGPDWQQNPASSQRQNPFISASNQRAGQRNDHDDSSQFSSNQQSSYDAAALQEQELRRRHDELRRKYEDERRKQEEDRRKLIDERRRQEEERRRLFHQQQQQRVNPQAANPQTSENNQFSRQNASQSSNPTSTNSRTQLPTTQTDNERRTSFSDHYSQSSYQRSDPFNQRRSQPFPSRGSVNSQQTDESSHHQQQYTERPRQGNPYQQQQQPVYRTNTSNHYPTSYDASHQQRQQQQQQQQGSFHGYRRQPGFVDPGYQTPQVFYQNFNTNNEQLGQGQGYSPQNRRPSIGSSFSFEHQDNDFDCPDTGIDLRINGLDCQQAVKQYGSYLCYTHEFTSRDCCHVCTPRKDSARTGCEYGDHAELCSSISPADCYDLRNKYSCCQTCERMKKHNLPPGCEYGDMTVRCDNVRQNPGLCYIPDNQRLCCETCSQIRNITNQGCPWGDYNSNLCQLFEENTVNVRINCYSQQRRKICCQACERLKDWLSNGLPADCQYGDKPVVFMTSQFGRLTCSNLFSYFSVDECNTNEAVSKNCCQTCHRLLNSRG